MLRQLWSSSMILKTSEQMAWSLSLRQMCSFTMTSSVSIKHSNFGCISRAGLRVYDASMLNCSVLEEWIKGILKLLFLVYLLWFCECSDESMEHEICFWVEGVNWEGEKFLKYLRDFFAFHLRLKWGDRIPKNTIKMSNAFRGQQRARKWALLSWQETEANVSNYWLVSGPLKAVKQNNGDTYA